MNYNNWDFLEDEKNADIVEALAKNTRVDQYGNLSLSNDALVAFLDALGDEITFYALNFQGYFPKGMKWPSPIYKNEGKTFEEQVLTYEERLVENNAIQRKILESVMTHVFEDAEDEIRKYLGVGPAMTQREIDIKENGLNWPCVSNFNKYTKNLFVENKSLAGMTKMPAFLRKQAD